MTTDSTGAESDLSGDGSKSDVAQPASESQGAKSPGDDSIPKSRFIAAINNVTAAKDVVEAENRRLKEQLAAREEKKPPTRAELKALVGTGEITEEQADLLWEKEIVERATREAAAKAGQVMGAHERSRKVEAELSGYQELVPEVWADGTPERAKVEKEFNRLAEMGYPRSPETEAVALRIVFGDVSTLRQSKSARPGPADTHSETGGHKPPQDTKSQDVLKTLSPQQRDYYGAGIKAGRYKDWAAVKAELEYVPKAKA